MDKTANFLKFSKPFIIGDILIRGWGETTSPFISRHLQDIGSSSYSQRFDKIANDVRSIHNLHLREIFNRLLYALSKEQEKRDSLKELFNAYQRESLKESLYFLKEQLNLELDEKVNNDGNSNKLHSTKKENINRKSFLLADNNTTLLNLVLELVKQYKTETKGNTVILSKNAESSEHDREVLSNQIQSLRKPLQYVPPSQSNLERNFVHSKKSLINPDVIIESQDILKSRDREEEAFPVIEERTDLFERSGDNTGIVVNALLS